MSSKTYWRDRELEWKKKRLKDEKQYADEIQEIYANMMDSVEKEIESFFTRYSNKENITMAEAKKRVSNIDIKAYQRKAKKYIKEKNFSDEANEQMRLYNLAMKVNRLELLKANIGLELVAGHDELKSYTGDKLEGAYLEEIKRNASILGDTVIDNAKMAKTVADSSFKNATFSERIWVNQDQLKNSLSSVLSNALIQGKNPREFMPQIRKKFDVSRCNAERLLRTEIARVQTQAQAESYEANGIDEYEYITCSLKDVCPLCKEMDGKTFKLKDMEIGENAPPLHPNCHCALAPYSDRKVYEQWLNGLASGEHNLRFDEWKSIDFNTQIEQHKKGNKVNITSQAINKIKNVRPTGYTEDEAHESMLVRQELLSYSKKYNNSNEVLALRKITNTEKTPTNFVKGTEDSVDFLGDSDTFHLLVNSSNRSLELVHNHPGLSYFSMNDINIFMIYPSIKTMMIVTNQGKTWYINKLDNFNFEEAKSVMKDALEKYKDKDVAIEKAIVLV
jgi:SPP1 gp7 family putative phage head morphogenesis protein